MSKEYIIKYKNNNIAVVYAYCANGNIKNEYFNECLPSIYFSYAPLLIFKATKNIDLIKYVEINLPEPIDNSNILIISVVRNQPNWFIPYLINYYKNKCSILVLYDFGSHHAEIVHSNDDIFTEFLYTCNISSKHNVKIENNKINCKPVIKKFVPKKEEIERCIMLKLGIMGTKLRDTDYKVYEEAISKFVKKR